MWDSGKGAFFMADGKKYPTPRGAAATVAKKKYRDKVYDRMELALPKGMKARMREAIERAGYTSFNAYVADAVKEKYSRDMGEEMILEPQNEE